MNILTSIQSVLSGWKGYIIGGSIVVYGGLLWGQIITIEDMTRITQQASQQAQDLAKALDALLVAVGPLVSLAGGAVMAFRAALKKNGQ